MLVYSSMRISACSGGELGSATKSEMDRHSASTETVGLPIAFVGVRISVPKYLDAKASGVLVWTEVLANGISCGVGLIS